MHARTIDEIGRAQQWTHVPVFTLLVSIVGFVHFYFGTGRLWLAIAACLARLVSLVINFAYPPNLNFREITGVRLFGFLGETVAMPEASAGFRLRTPETPKQKEIYASLPAYKVHRINVNGQTFYVYKDEAKGIAFVGREAEYQRYRQMAKQDAFDDNNTVIMDDAAARNWSSAYALNNDWR